MMKINSKIIIIGMALLMVTFSSCEKAEQDVSPIVSPDGKPMITFTTDYAGGAVKEGDTIFFSASTDKTILRSITVGAHIIGGTLQDSDIEVKNAVIAPYTTESTEGYILFFTDWNVEELETAELEIGIFSLADNFLVDASLQHTILDLSVSNYTSDTLTMVFAWEKDIEIEAGLEDLPGFPDLSEIVYTVGTCDMVDFDIYVADAEGFDINDPWATSFEFYDAATGDCPETMKFAGWPNGSYILFSDLYVNDFSEVEIPEVVKHVDIPITFYWDQQGVTSGDSLVQDPSQTMNTTTPGYDNVSWAGEIVDTFIAKVTVLNGTYTIVGWEDSGLSATKSSKVRTPRPANFNRK